MSLGDIILALIVALIVFFAALMIYLLVRKPAQPESTENLRKMSVQA